MDIYTEDMNQQATYWAPQGNDGFGNVSYAAPVAIMCRWQSQSTLYRDQNGQSVASAAVVYVDRRLEIKGKLALGAHTGSPVASALEVRQLAESPDLDAEEVLLKVFL